MALWKKMTYSSSPKKEVRTPNTEGLQQIWNFHSPLLQDAKKFFSPHKKIFVGGREGIY